MGHLVESMALAESLKKAAKCRVVFLVKKFPPALKMLEEQGYKVETLEEGMEDEAKAVTEFAKTQNIDILFFDFSNKGNEYYRKVKTKAMKVVILDNDKNEHVPGDVVVNFSIIQNKDFYKNNPNEGTTYLVGPKYVPIPEAMHEMWKNEKAIGGCRNIFLNQGGSDPFGLTTKIIKSLERLNLKVRITVMVGQAVLEEQKRELRMMESKLKNNYRFEWGVSPESIYDIMDESDMAITAAGNTLYELAVFGVPSIVICHHEMHNKVASKFAEKNAVINMGVGGDLKEKEISQMVEKVINSKGRRLELSRNIKKVTDGLGSKRVAEKLPKNVKFMKFDITEEHMDLPMDMDIMLHLATIKGSEQCKRNPEETRNTNVEGTRKLLGASIRSNAKRFIFSSTYWVYDSVEPPFTEDMKIKPTELYGSTKAEAEKEVASSGMSYNILRFTNIFGLGSGIKPEEVIFNFIKAGFEGRPIVLHGGEQKLDFIEIGDVCRILLKLIETETLPSGIYNVGSGRPVSIESMARMVKDIFKRGYGMDVEIVSVDGKRQRDRYVSVGKLETAIGDLGLKPLEKSIKAYIESYKRRKL
jgi:spore coat polysaccharide biosynthesis predicted glycosyltransferase SpsG